MRRALLVLALAACDPYDPSLGDIPFTCGTDSPRCPEGYVTVDVSAIRCECQRAEIAPDPDDLYECSDDPQEPNDSVATAFDTMIGGVNPQPRNFPSSICPPGGPGTGDPDEDFFELTSPRTGTLIRVDTMFDIARPPPSVDILTKDGANAGSATESPTAGLLVTTYTAPAVASYVIRVRAEKEVNYLLRIMIIPPA